MHQQHRRIVPLTRGLITIGKAKVAGLKDIQHEPSGIGLCAGWQGWLRLCGETEV